jgi:hypothetical protein
MNKKFAYSEKLKDPRWQKKRLDVFSRDDWSCVFCQRKDKTLHVHHLKYDQGKDPWEYDLDFLVTACEECHELEHELRGAYENDLIINMKLAKLSFYDVKVFADFIKATTHFSDTKALRDFMRFMSEYNEKFYDDLIKSFPK